MNREEFLRQLNVLLRDIPENDRLDAIAYYNDYFDEAGAENEKQVIAELESPQKVSEKIKEDLNIPLEPENPLQVEHVPQADNNTDSQKKNTSWPLIIIILVLTFPLWIGLVGGLFGLVVGLFGGAIGIVFGLFGAAIGLIFGGIGLIIGGIFSFSLIEALTLAGIGAILAAIGILILILDAWICIKWIPALCKAIVRGCRKLFQKK